MCSVVKWGLGISRVEHKEYKDFGEVHSHFMKSECKARQIFEAVIFCVGCFIFCFGCFGFLFLRLEFLSRGSLG